ncbi:MAG: hypothetical protein IJG13_04700 [Kiritimatiellae bacterium]|nr:hypothetical protein [Kiritimatiellia bacterium]MBQ3344821.1 hypothetical protein [Kiritimatiellia bacterium]
MATMSDPVASGKYPRPLDVMLFLRDQPLGEVLVEPLEVVGYHLRH